MGRLLWPDSGHWPAFSLFVRVVDVLPREPLLRMREMRLHRLRRIEEPLAALEPQVVVLAPEPRRIRGVLVVVVACEGRSVVPVREVAGLAVREVLPDLVPPRPERVLEVDEVVAHTVI